jgi:hypothetical protein
MLDGFRPALGPTEHFIPSLRGLISRGVRRPKHEAPYRIEVKAVRVSEAVRLEV